MDVFEEDKGKAREENDERDEDDEDDDELEDDEGFEFIEDSSRPIDPIKDPRYSFLCGILSFLGVFI